MRGWMNKMIDKHTCHFCEKKLNKKEIYTINMDTLEGPHKVSACEKCAMEFDHVLKHIQEIHNG